MGVSAFAMWSAVSMRQAAQRAIASNTLSDHYAAAAAAAAAVDRGDAALVLQIDNDEVDPRFDTIDGLVNKAADSHHANALADLANLKQSEEFNAMATPAVFFVGFVFVVFFASVLRRTRVQLDRQRARAVHDALHDALTGRPNRTLLADRFGKALREGNRTTKATALLLIDLDRFKEVNDTLGHHVGDLLLAQIGPRLSGVLRGVDSVARLGGDEFAVLLPAVDDLNGALDNASRLRVALAGGFKVEGVALEVDASIGVVLSGVHGDDA